jgi:hypothetical protein
MSRCWRGKKNARHDVCGHGNGGRSAGDGKRTATYEVRYHATNPSFYGPIGASVIGCEPTAPLLDWRGP